MSYYKREYILLDFFLRVQSQYDILQKPKCVSKWVFSLPEGRRSYIKEQERSPETAEKHRMYTEL
jgi:hypothetical protein